MGPDAGAKTPGEIALVAMVGVLAALRGRCRPPLKAEPVQRDTAAAADGKFINPVCGMAVSIANPLHVEQYEGEAYYFCCDGCWTTFRKDPAKFAAIRQLT